MMHYVLKLVIIATATILSSGSRANKVATLKSNQTWPKPVDGEDEQREESLLGDTGGAGDKEEGGEDAEEEGGEDEGGEDAEDEDGEDAKEESLLGDTGAKNKCCKNTEDVWKPSWRKGLWMKTLSSEEVCARWWKNKKWGASQNCKKCASNWSCSKCAGTCLTHCKATLTAGCTDDEEEEPEEEEAADDEEEEPEEEMAAARMQEPEEEAKKSSCFSEPAGCPRYKKNGWCKKSYYKRVCKCSCPLR